LDSTLELYLRNLVIAPVLIVTLALLLLAI
jgi:hypothetical protein